MQDCKLKWFAIATVPKLSTEILRAIIAITIMMKLH